MNTFLTHDRQVRWIASIVTYVVVSIIIAVLAVTTGKIINPAGYVVGWGVGLALVFGAEYLWFLFRRKS
jgi:uncharacterized membrane protein